MCLLWAPVKVSEADEVWESHLRVDGTALCQLKSLVLSTVVL